MRDGRCIAHHQQTIHCQRCTEELMESVRQEQADANHKLHERLEKAVGALRLARPVLLTGVAPETFPNQGDFVFWEETQRHALEACDAALRAPGQP